MFGTARKCALLEARPGSTLLRLELFTLDSNAFLLTVHYQARAIKRQQALQHSPTV